MAIKEKERKGTDAKQAPNTKHFQLADGNFQVATRSEQMLICSGQIVICFEQMLTRFEQIVQSRGQRLILLFFKIRKDLKKHRR